MDKVGQNTNREVPTLPAQFNDKASVWLMFIKKNIMPTRHNSTISIERIMLLYCIMMEISINVGKIICEHLTTWIKHPCRAKSFPCLIKQLCIKACSELEKSPQVQVNNGVSQNQHSIASSRSTKSKQSLET